MTSLRSRIAQLDLEVIRTRCAKKYGWSAVRAHKAEEAYREFLHLDLEVPSPDVDEMWHTHILDTERYATDCLFLYNSFLHHIPEARCRKKVA